MNLAKSGALLITAAATAIFIWANLPFQWIYRTEIKEGTEFAAHLKTYYKKYERLPSEQASGVLSKLYPSSNWDSFWPEYRIVDSTNFTLTYIEGFDGPYLTYNSKSKTWEMR